MRSVPRCGQASQTELRVPLEDLLFESRTLALAPQLCPVDHPIQEGSAVRPINSLDRPWDADELGLERIRRGTHGRVAMTPEIEERQVRGQIRIGEPSCLTGIARSLVFQAGA